MAKEFTKITAPVEGEYEGKPTISIPLASGRPFSFGVEKAAAIVKHIEAVKAWSAKHPSQAGAGNVPDVTKLTAEQRNALLAQLMQ